MFNQKFFCVNKSELAALSQDVLPSPWGSILIQANAYGVCRLAIVAEEVCNLVLPDNQKRLSYLDEAQRHVEQAKEELSQYLNGQRHEFSVALAPWGTEFQRQVWQSLLKVPYGGVCSYADIAEDIENPNAVRAVGAANGRNPIAIIVPCHRVIGKNGKLTGYAYGLSMKQALLQLEQSA